MTRTTMTLLYVNLPDDLKAQAERRAAEAGFPSVSDYVEALIRADADADAPSTPDAAVRAVLRERLSAGPATPMTSADFAHIRARLDEQIAKRRSR
jgi:Arc/MetJ-type ribon-helix-helix transcriptional regulator